MLFTWSSKNLCIIFPQWRVTGTFSLIVSLIAIILLTAGYELVRDMSRKYEESHSAQLQAYSNSAFSTLISFAVSFGLTLRSVKTRLQVSVNQAHCFPQETRPKLRLRGRVPLSRLLFMPSKSFTASSSCKLTLLDLKEESLTWSGCYS